MSDATKYFLQQLAEHGVHLPDGFWVEEDEEDFLNLYHLVNGQVRFCGQIDTESNSMNDIAAWVKRTIEQNSDLEECLATA